MSRTALWVLRILSIPGALVVATLFVLAFLLESVHRVADRQIPGTLKDSATEAAHEIFSFYYELWTMKAKA